MPYLVISVVALQKGRNCFLLRPAQWSLPSFPPVMDTDALQRRDIHLNFI